MAALWRSISLLPPTLGAREYLADKASDAAVHYFYNYFRFGLRGYLRRFFPRRGSSNPPVVKKFAGNGSFTKVKGVITDLINRLPSETSFCPRRACAVSALMFYFEDWKPTTQGTTSTQDPGGVLSQGTDD